MVTVVPTGPLVGEKLIVAPAPTVKFVALSAVPLGVVTCNGPVLAPTGTVAVIEVGELTVNTVAAVVLNMTPVVPQKFVPVMFTVEPTGPVAGENDVIVAAAAEATTKLPALTVLPDGASTAMVPVDAPAGTVVVIEVSEATVNAGWLTPPKRTAVAGPGVLNPVPVIVTGVPTTPHTGVNEVIVAADAGTAAKSTPMTPRTSASEVARAETFRFWNRKSGSSFRELRVRCAGATYPAPGSRRSGSFRGEHFSTYPIEEHRTLLYQLRAQDPPFGGGRIVADARPKRSLRGAILVFVRGDR